MTHWRSGARRLIFWVVLAISSAVGYWLYAQGGRESTATEVAVDHARLGTAETQLAQNSADIRDLRTSMDQLTGSVKAVGYLISVLTLINLAYSAYSRKPTA